MSSYSKRSEEGTEGNIFYASGFTLKGSCSYMRLGKLWKVTTLWCEIRILKSTLLEEECSASSK